MAEEDDIEEAKKEPGPRTPLLQNHPTSPPTTSGNPPVILNDLSNDNVASSSSSSSLPPLAAPPRPKRRRNKKRKKKTTESHDIIGSGDGGGGGGGSSGNDADKDEDEGNDDDDDDDEYDSSVDVSSSSYYSFFALSSANNATMTGGGGAGRERQMSNNNNKCCCLLQPLFNCLRVIFTVLTDDTGDVNHIIRGIATVFGLGLILGITLPRNEELNGLSYQYISSIIGWTYFMAWSISFYPQVFLNFRRKDTEGLSVDFCLLNVFGFTCYTIFNATLYWSDSVRALYANRHNGTLPLVEPNDVGFAIHAVILSCVTVGQIAYYNGSFFFFCRRRHHHNHRQGRRPSILASVSLLVMISLSLIYALCIVIAGGDDKGVTTSSSSSRTQLHTHHHVNWLDFIYMLANFKIFITIIKYIPQVVLNYKRKSTIGWNIWNVLLDFTGGSLSILQLILDSWNTNNWVGITGNPAKFSLGFVSIFFDIIFIVQHYILYRKSSSDSTSDHDNTNLNSPTSSSHAAHEIEQQPLNLSLLSPPPPTRSADELEEAEKEFQSGLL